MISTIAKTIRNPGAYATGKGTTAAIKAAFPDIGSFCTVTEVAVRIGKPSRQLNKRFAELVKSGFLSKRGTFGGVTDYIRNK